MKLNKTILVLIALAAVAMLAVPAYAQGDDPADAPDGDRAACLEALQALREAGEPITPDNLPEACEGLRPGRFDRPEVSEECRVALAELRDSGERVNRDNLPEACADELPLRDRFPGGGRPGPGGQAPNNGGPSNDA